MRRHGLHPFFALERERHRPGNARCGGENLVQLLLAALGLARDISG